MQTAFIGPIIRILARRVTIPFLERAGANFAKVRGADLLRGIVPAWLQRALQIGVLPSSLVTRLPLPIAFSADVFGYAIYADGQKALLGDDGFAAFWETIKAYGQLFAEEGATRQQLADYIAQQINDSVSINGDGTLTVSVPPVWMRDP